MTTPRIVESLATNVGGAPAEAPLVEGTQTWSLHEPATEVDAKDKGTADAWIPRDPRIQRLTGRHPLNCEPPMDVLMTSFVTAPSVHYVRNHGPAPKLEWATHRIEVGGLVDRPLSLSMDELVALPSVTRAVTLVCAGNRRKEENMLKKSIGFNWGPCAVSTSYWTGARLGDVLRLAGVTQGAGAQYVCFRGPKGELPKGADGSYGTSLRLGYAMADANDVLVAYKQNGRWLTPDHGFPVRMLIPGFIGGRMVKWLSEITVTAQESDNHYHFFDNRVMPPHVDEALASKEDWWYRPDFIINDLNINSAMSRPWHDEIVPLATNAPYTLRGYAYSGGGRKVIRCEISLDGGVTWAQADIDRGPYAEPTEDGKHWCWVHWSLEVATLQLAGAKEVLLRAWDEAMNTQPALITWNLMGMMNNCHYRVLVHHHVDAQGNLGLRFQHPAPVAPGALGTIGWREEEAAARAGAPATVAAALSPAAVAAAAAAAAAEPVAAPVAAVAPPPPAAGGGAAPAAAAAGGRRITMAEVEQHVSEESAWFVYEGRVYDATPFLDDHPGGADSILISTGADVTDEFNSIHSTKAKAMLAEYYIGDLAAEGEEPAAAPPVAAAAPAPPPLSAPTINGHASSSSSSSSSDAADGVPAAVNGHHANGHHANGHPANGYANGYANGHANGGAAALSTAPVALDPRSKVAFRLQQKESLSPNVVRLRFALQSPQHKFGLPVGKHVFVYASIGGENVMRAYTPVSGDEHLGYFELVVKVYRAGEHPNFPDGGKMSQHLDALALGDAIDVKGPVGHMVYEGRGRYSLNRKPFAAERISLIAGGTGITPCWQVLRTVLEDPQDTTQVALLYANRCEEDILLRSELDAYAAAHPQRFRVWYTLDQPPEGWTFATGHINEDMLTRHLLPAGPGAIACVCGPPGMVKFACLPNLAAMGYAEAAVIQF